MVSLGLCDSVAGWKGFQTMANEKKWDLVPPQPFTATGTVDGHITVADSRLFHVKQTVIIFSDALGPILFQTKQINSLTDIVVGPVSQDINSRSDMSAYLLSSNPMISANTQERYTIRPEAITRAVYQEEPAVAIRTLMVDPLGDFYDDENPLPIAFDGTISIGRVEVEGTNGNTIEPNPSGSVNVVVENGNSSTTRSIYAEQMVVPDLATNIVTYTVPAGKTAILEKITGSGQQIGRFDMLLNGSAIDTQRNYYGNFNITSDFMSGGGGFKLLAGDTILLTVVGQETPAFFSGRIQITESV